MTEDYVSFEVAKLLSKNGFGFPEDCFTYYTLRGIVCEKGKSEEVGIAPRPTLQMAMKWLREKEIFIAICHCTYPRERKVTWLPEISTFDSVFPDSAIEYDTYEEACEEAIKYCLENLI